MTVAGVLLAVGMAGQVARADTATVAPTGDSSTGSWSSTPLFEKVDEDIDSPDGVLITSSNNPSTPSNDVVFALTCPADTGEITEANLRVRAEKTSGARNVSLAVSWSATAATDFNTGNLGALSNYASGNQTGLSISKATCNSSTVTIAPTTTGGGQPAVAGVDTVNLDIVYTAGAAKKRVIQYVVEMRKIAAEGN